jgi:hypothetical protein
MPMVEQQSPGVAATPRRPAITSAADGPCLATIRPSHPCMDPALAMLVAAPPVDAGQLLLLPGPAGPVPVAWTALADAAVVRLCLDRPDLPATHGIGPALRLGRLDEAWILVRRARSQPGGDLAASGDLAAWAGAEALRLGVTGRQAVVVRTGNAEHDLTLGREAGLAHRALVDLLGGIGYPGWSGPLIAAAASVPDLPASDRPALPVSRIDPPASMDRTALDVWRGALGQALVRAHLAQLPSPPAGWPAWLADGLAAVADAHVRGVGPSPRDALDLRRNAGLAGLRRLVAGTGGDQPGLAAALVTGLVQPRRVASLPRLLDLLRHGAAGETACNLAGIPLSGLIDDR